MAKAPKTPRRPLDEGAWAEAERKVDDWFAKAPAALDRHYRESGKQPPTGDKARDIIEGAALHLALIDIAYINRIHARDMTDMHERIAKLERQAKGATR